MPQPWNSLSRGKNRLHSEFSESDNKQENETYS